MLTTLLLALMLQTTPPPVSEAPATCPPQPTCVAGQRFDAEKAACVPASPSDQPATQPTADDACKVNPLYKGNGPKANPLKERQRDRD